MAYGQTGSGKTHTMLGQPSKNRLVTTAEEHDSSLIDLNPIKGWIPEHTSPQTEDGMSSEQDGLIPRAVRQLFM